MSSEHVSSHGSEHDGLRDHLDLLVDTDPLRLRDEAIALLHRAEKAEAERDRLRLAWESARMHRRSSRILNRELGRQVRHAQRRAGRAEADLAETKAIATERSEACARAEAERDQIRAGEDATPRVEGCWLTPGQLIYRLNSLDAESRLAQAARLIEAMQQADKCFRMDHTGLSQENDRLRERAEQAKVGRDLALAEWGEETRRLYERIVRADAAITRVRVLPVRTSDGLARDYVLKAAVLAALDQEGE